MVTITRSEIAELKVIRMHDSSDSRYLEFLPRKSFLNKGYAILLFGGTLGTYVVVFSARVEYKSDLDEKATFDKICKYVPELKNKLVSIIYESLESLPKNIV